MGWADIWRSVYADILVQKGDNTYTPQRQAQLAGGAAGLTPTQVHWLQVHVRRIEQWRNRALYLVGAGALGAGAGYLVGRYTGVATQVWWNMPWIGGRALLSIPIGVLAPDEWTGALAAGVFNLAAVPAEVAGVWKQAEAWAREQGVETVYHGYQFYGQAVRNAWRQYVPSGAVSGAMSPLRGNLPYLWVFW